MSRARSTRAEIDFVRRAVGAHEGNPLLSLNAVYEAPAPAIRSPHGWVRWRMSLPITPVPLARVELRAVTSSVSDGEFTPFISTLTDAGSIEIDRMIKLPPRIAKLVLVIRAPAQLPENVRLELSALSRPGVVFRSVAPLVARMARGELPEPALDKHVRGIFREVKGALGSIKTNMKRTLNDLSLEDFNYDEYSKWISEYDLLSDEDLPAIQSLLGSLSSRPRFEVFLLAEIGDRASLSRSIGSVAGQIYPDWRLHVFVAGSPTSAELEMLKREFVDPRISFELLGAGSGSGALSAAIRSRLSERVEGGSWAMLLDSRSALAAHALSAFAVAADRAPKANILYCDEDALSESGRRTNPNFKPDWNLELQLSSDLLGFASPCRASLLSASLPDDDVPLALFSYATCAAAALAAGSERVAHLPYVLNHVSLGGSPFQSRLYHSPSDLAPFVRVLQSRLERAGSAARVEPGAGAGTLRVRPREPARLPRVSFLVCTRDRLELLRGVIDGLTGLTDYPDKEILVVDNQSEQPATREYLEQLQKDGIARVIRYDARFNFSRMNNVAAREATGEVLCFMNNDLKMIHADWLTEMVAQLLQDGVGMVGAKLYFPDDRIQHAGVALGIGGVAGHIYRLFPRASAGMYNRLNAVQAMSCVTAACALIRREIFEQVGGFNEKDLAVAFNDVDLCLKVRRAGHKIIWTPHAELYHLESATRGPDTAPENQKRFQGEMAYIQEEWRPVLYRDPFYNPNLTFAKDDLSLAWPPRVKPLWKS